MKQSDKYDTYLFISYSFKINAAQSDTELVFLIHSCLACNAAAGALAGIINFFT